MIQWRSQNLSTQEYRDENGRWCERVTAPMWRHGRGWLKLGYQERPYKRGSQIGVSWKVGRPVYFLGAGVEVDRDQDEPVSFHVCLWPFSVYLNVDSKAASWIAQRVGSDSYDDRDRLLRLDIGTRDERGIVRWHLWWRDHVWSSTDPKWRRGSINLVELVLGRREMRWEPKSTLDVLIPMPERSYPAKVELRDHVSWYKRLPFWTKRIEHASIDIPGGIGHPGKGENAWDCGDDATFGMSCPAHNAEEAVGKLVASVLRDRKRYGGTYEFTPMERAA